MEYFNLINDFVDGSLNSENEEKLFRELSTNEDLRTDLKETIKIDKAMNKRLSVMAPSSSATLGIFSQLGITGAVVTGAAVKSCFFTKYTQGFIGALSAAAVTTLMFLTIRH